MEREVLSHLYNIIRVSYSDYPSVNGFLREFERELWKAVDSRNILKFLTKNKMDVFEIGSIKRMGIHHNDKLILIEPGGLEIKYTGLAEENTPYLRNEHSTNALHLEGAAHIIISDKHNHLHLLELFPKDGKVVFTPLVGKDTIHLEKPKPILALVKYGERIYSVKFPHKEAKLLV